VINAIVQDPISTGVTFALIFTGVPVYFAAFSAKRTR